MTAIIICLLLHNAVKAAENEKKLCCARQQVQGQLLDFTKNHQGDHRLWSNALCQKRDMYVYLPVGYTPKQAYPLMIWLHGFAQDEKSFARDVVLPLERAMLSGQIPPMIVAAPDGSISGEGVTHSPGSYFINSKAGRFEDYVMQDVWPFLHANFSIRPEPEAHVFAGASMGGGASFNLGIKYRQQAKVVLGLYPPLNLRWENSKGKYFADFDPADWGWRSTCKHGGEVIAKFGPLKHVHLQRMLDPIVNHRNPEAIQLMKRENPIEMLCDYGIQRGDLAMYVGYGKQDEFNLDAQVESFLYRANEMNLEVTWECLADGKHDLRTALALVPKSLTWLNRQLEGYGPCSCPGPLPVASKN